MKNQLSNFFLTCSVLMLIPMSFAQDIMWEKSFGGRHAEYLTDIQPTADYGFILGGSSLSQKSGNKTEEGRGDLDFCIWKLDEDGEVEWQKSFGGSGTDMLKVIRTTHDGGFILAGTSNSPKDQDKEQENHGGNDYWIVKLDAKGEQLWQQTFGGKGQDDLEAIVLTNDGGYVVAGSSDSSPVSNDKGKNIKRDKSQGNLDYWIVKLDVDGKELWQKSFGGKYADQLRSIALTKDNGFLIGGYSNSPISGIKSQDNYGRGGDFWILKLDEMGSVEWQQTIGGDKDDQLQVVHQGKDGNYIVAGNSGSTTRTSKNGTDLWILKLDETGNTLWEGAYDIGDVDILTSLVENEDHSMLLCGYSPVTYTGNNDKEGVNDFVAIKIDKDGRELWRKVHGSAGQDILKKMVISRDGGYILAGTSNPEFKGYVGKKGKSSVSEILLGNQNEGIADNVKKEMDTALQDLSNDVNGKVKNEIGNATKKINDIVGDNSGLKMGIGDPKVDFLNSLSGGKSSTNNSDATAKSEAAKGPKPGTKSSRDKSIQLGRDDFWILKLKDNEKKLKEKIKIEAIPNPALTFTNIIVGFDFDHGTAMLYDLTGRQLQNFKIDSRTVPVDVSNLPEGVYIVNITTNKGSGSVKIIKGN